jgi:hypothetical protein
VRIHLDVVEGLSAFIEFEAIASADSDLTHEEARVNRLRQAFEVEDADLIGGSYCDLMLCAWPGWAKGRRSGGGCVIGLDASRQGLVGSSFQAGFRHLRRSRLE